MNEYNQNTSSYGQFANYRTVPLAIHLKVLFGGFAAQFGWAFFSFGMIFVWVFATQVDFSYFYFDENSPRSEGTVTKTESTNASVNKRTVYAVYYEFKNSQGKAYQGVSYTTGFIPQNGKKVRIQYLENTPDYSRIEGMSKAVFPPFVLFVVLFPFIGLCFIVGGIVFSLQGIKLLKSGKLTKGKLVQMLPTNATINKRPVMKLIFEFAAENGQTYQANAQTHTPENLMDEQEEKLLYDTFNPSKAVMLDNLPGSPKIQEDGSIAPSPLTSVFPVLILPAIGIFGHGLAFWMLYG